MAIFGNFVNRAVVLTHKYFGGKVPACASLLDVDKEVLAQIPQLRTSMENNLENYRFREALKDASGAMSQSMNLNDGSSNGSSFGRWGMQAIQNAYQKTTNAISKNIRKNKVKVKYGTQVYLINSKEKNRNNR